MRIYSTIYIGGDDSAFAEYGSFLGLAEQVDVGNSECADNSFVFSELIYHGARNVDEYVAGPLQVIAHEAGHLLGYAHDTEHEQDVVGPLHPVAASVTGISATAAIGTPANELIASANIRQAITINGSDFDSGSDMSFPIVSSDGTTGTRTMGPTRVADDGTSLEGVVPDDAMTGEVTVAGADGSAVLQIVPIIEDIDLLSDEFAEGSRLRILGSGFTEGDLTVRFGATEVEDTDVSAGPDVFNARVWPHSPVPLGVGLDRSDNDGIHLEVPASAATGPISVETAGGQSAAWGSFLMSLTEVRGTALEGTPANPALPSANPGQTILLLGGGFDLTIEAIFPTVDVDGALSNLAVLPDFVNANGTLMQTHVPDSAITGNIRVVGAAGTFRLQIVPTLELAEQVGGDTVYLLGGGFTEGTGLRVYFDGVPVEDTGSNIDVRNGLLSNDTLFVYSAPATSGSVRVMTAAGTSPAVDIAVDDPPGVSGIWGMDIFPVTAGDDAGRLLVVGSASGTPLRVLDPADLSVVRTLDRPGAAANISGVAFLTDEITVGGVTVPAGSLVVVNGAETPDRLYYLDPTGSGTVLADVPLGGLTPVDEAGAVEVAYHATRGTLFVLRYHTDLVTEIDPSTGSAIQSFHTGFGLSYYYDYSGGLAVHSIRDTLLLGGSSARLVELDPESGRVTGTYDPIDNAQLGTIDLHQQGVSAPHVSNRDVTGLAFDSGGNLLASTYAGWILTLRLPGAPTALQVDGMQAVSMEGVPADSLRPSANVSQRIQIVGSGLVEGATEVTFGGVWIDDNCTLTLVNLTDGSFRFNGRLSLVVPERALAGPVKVETAGGWFQVDMIPIASQTSVGLDEIEATAPEGTPTDAILPSANAGQVIALRGYGFASTSNIIFPGVAEDGTRGQIVTRPSTVSSTEMTGRVPALAVSGQVTIAGSGTGVDLQIVPTLDGISVGTLTPWGSNPAFGYRDS